MNIMFKIDDIKMPSNEYYIVSKEFVDSLYINAQIKKAEHEFPNEMFIEAEAILMLLEYIKENSQLIKSEA